MQAALKKTEVTASPASVEEDRAVRRAPEQGHRQVEPPLVHFRNLLLNMKIANRLTLWFLAIAIVPCGILALVTYRMSERSIEDTIHRTLLVTAEQKTAQIET